MKQNTVLLNLKKKNFVKTNMKMKHFISKPFVFFTLLEIFLAFLTKQFTEIDWILKMVPQICVSFSDERERRV